MDSESLRLSNRINKNQKAIEAYTGSKTLMPVGSILAWVKEDIPAGWLWCNGQSVSKAKYSELFAAIGTTYGDDGDNFLLPNFTGRVPVGQNPSDSSFNTLGEIGGSKTVTLTSSHVPSHRHTINHGHGASSGANNYSHTHSISHTHASTTTGSDGHNYAYGFGSSGSEKVGTYLLIQTIRMSAVIVTLSYVYHWR